MKKKFLKTVLPVMLLVVAVFIIGSGCTGDPDEYNYNWYPDMDEDGYGDGSATPISASNSNAPAGYVRDTSDCNDSDASINPDAIEVAGNNIDENCNGLHAITFYADEDGDGFGDEGTPEVIEVTLGDEAPSGFSYNATDCEDSDPAINPLAFEILDNGIDDNCDGETDVFEVYVDEDGDGYGSNQMTAAEGVHNNLDCDDDNADIYPYRAEIIGNDIDDNCNGITDEIN
ncbi:MAG TPA: hypothetical protein EYO76_01970 [Flavobacteriaceae bacterium]|nr:hypothetical protein [Flavobacteriaceae bacterium]